MIPRKHQALANLYRRSGCRDPFKTEFAGCMKPSYYVSSAAYLVAGPAISTPWFCPAAPQLGNDHGSKRSVAQYAAASSSASQQSFESERAQTRSDSLIRFNTSEPSQVMQRCVRSSRWTHHVDIHGGGIDV